jgi:prolyl 4-hydroxylase
MNSVRDAVARIESGRHEEGLRLLREQAKQGDSDAVYVLANLLWTGTVVPQDPVRGRLLLQHAASLGHAQANLFTTNLLASGIAGSRDWSAALDRLAAEGRQLRDRQRALDLIRQMDLDSAGDPMSAPAPQVLAEQPYARLFKRLLTESECAYLIDAGEGLFKPSMVHDKSGELVRDTIRTSEGAAVDWLAEDPAIHAVLRRLAAVTGTAYDRGEALQVLRYSPRQEYRPHFDYLEASDNPRPWTALVYLNSGYEGGATAFVQTGLEVQGATGDVLVFRNNTSDGRRDPLAEHAGLPVTDGVKFLATRWIRESRWTP